MNEPFPPTQRRGGWRRAAVRLVRGALVVYLLVLLGMTFIERRLVYPAPPLAWGDWSPSGDDYEDVWIDVEPTGKATDRSRVHGWFFDRDDADYAVLYCHGNGTDVAQQPPLARRLRDRLNAAVLVFDYRGYGKSDGVPTEAGVIADGVAAARWLADRTSREPHEVVLIGRSLGGGVATAIAAQQGAEALVLQSTFTRLVDAAAWHYPWLPVRLLMVNRFDSLERIVLYDGPTLVSHGAEDEVVPFEQGRRLYEAAVGRKEFVALEGLGHNAAQPALYDDRLSEFLAAAPSASASSAAAPGDSVATD